MLGKVTFDEQVNVLEIALFPKLKVLKGLISRSDDQNQLHASIPPYLKVCIVSA